MIGVEDVGRKKNWREAQHSSPGFGGVRSPCLKTVDVENDRARPRVLGIQAADGLRNVVFTGCSDEIARRHIWFIEAAVGSFEAEARTCRRPELRACRANAIVFFDGWIESEQEGAKEGWAGWRWRLEVSD
jgi:hypothetical protein